MITVKTIYGEEVEVDEKDITFVVNVYGVIVKDGKVLISPQYDGYSFPGGHMDMAETVTQCLVREVEEETGFIVKPTKILGLYTNFFMHSRKKTPHKGISIYYAADIVSGCITTKGFDPDESSYAKEARFVTLKELKSMNFRFSSQQPLDVIIPYVRRKQK